MKEPGRSSAVGGHGSGSLQPFLPSGRLVVVEGSLAWRRDELCVTVRKAGVWEAARFPPWLSGSMWSRHFRWPARQEKLNSTSACWSDKEQIEAVAIECLKSFSLWV